MIASQDLTEDHVLHLSWPLPVHPKARPVGCGVEPGRLHTVRVTQDRLLVYGKLDLLVCYARDGQPESYVFTQVIRYLSAHLPCGSSDEAGAVEAHPARVSTALSAAEATSQVTVDIELAIGLSAARHSAPSRGSSGPAPRASYDRGQRLGVEQPPGLRGAENLAPIVWAMPRPG